MKKGFTLVELLVAISIAVLIGTIVIVGLEDVKKKNRDLARIQDLHNIAQAIEKYYSDHGEYPPPSGSSDQSAIEGQDNFMVAIQPYFPNGKLPVDPINKGCYFPSGACDPTAEGDWFDHAQYRYTRIYYNPGDPNWSWNNCGGADYFLLQARMETIKQGHPQYKTCICPYPRLCGIRQKYDFNPVSGDWDIPISCDSAPYGSPYSCAACPAMPDVTNNGDYCSNDGSNSYIVECNGYEQGSMQGEAYSICDFAVGD